MYPCRKTRKDQTTQVTPWPVACGRRRQRHFPHSSTPLAQLSKLLAHLRRCELFVHIQIATPEPLKRLLLQVRIDYAMSFGPFFDIQLLWEPFFQNSQALHVPYVCARLWWKGPPLRTKRNVFDFAQPNHSQHGVSPKETQIWMTEKLLVFVSVYSVDCSTPILKIILRELSKDLIHPGALN